MSGDFFSALMYYSALFSLLSWRFALSYAKVVKRTTIKSLKKP